MLRWVEKHISLLLCWLFKNLKKVTMKVLYERTIVSTNWWIVHIVILQTRQFYLRMICKLWIIKYFADGAMCVGNNALHSLHGTRVVLQGNGIFVRHIIALRHFCDIAVLSLLTWSYAPLNVYNNSPLRCRQLSETPFMNIIIIIIIIIILIIVICTVI